MFEGQKGAFSHPMHLCIQCLVTGGSTISRVRESMLRALEESGLVEAISYAGISSPAFLRFSCSCRAAVRYRVDPTRCPQLSDNVAGI